jgi:hypothetical protein
LTHNGGFGYNIHIVSKKELEMKNWTDSCINWNQLTGTEVKRLIATWGKDEKFIAKYDKAHGFDNPVPKVTEAKVAPTKTEKPAKAPAKKVGVRQQYVGKDGEVQFLEHRNAWVGFYGGRRVVMKSTKEKCLAALRTEYKLEV